MPIEPRFFIQQTDDEVCVVIKVPYVRVGDAEVHVDGCNFTFYCKPYLLKLCFPHELRGSEDEANCRALYEADVDHGTLTTHLKKKEKGVFFENLDLTTALLQPVEKFAKLGATRPGSSEASVPPVIEVISSETTDETHDGGDSTEAAAQAPSCNHVDGWERPASTVSLSKPHYGFNRQYLGVFAHLRDELMDVIRLRDPEAVPEALRSELRRTEEAADFDAERYLGDLCEATDDPIYDEARRFKAFWESETEDESEVLDDEAKEELATLKNREHLIGDEYAVLLQLVDIILAFAYDHRTTGGEPTVESCWTITTLSPSLSWLETYGCSTPALRPDVRAVVIAFVRRCLIYPYLRLWDLAMRVVEDVRTILKKGRRVLLRCLLRVRKVLRRTETHYLLNRIFLDDYCVWVQHVEDETFARVAVEYEAAIKQIKKGDVDLNVPTLEALLSEEAVEDHEDSDSGESDEDEYSTSSEEEAHTCQTAATDEAADAIEPVTNGEAVVDVAEEVRAGIEGLTLVGQREGGGEGENKSSDASSVSQRTSRDKLDVPEAGGLLASLSHSAGKTPSCEVEPSQNPRPLIEEI